MERVVRAAFNLNFSNKEGQRKQKKVKESSVFASLKLVTSLESNR